MDHAGHPEQDRQNQVNPEVSAEARHQEHGQRGKQNSDDDKYEGPQHKLPPFAIRPGICLTAAGFLLLCLFHALREERFEFAADFLGLTFEFVEKLALLVLDITVSKEHLP